ncbi:unnamed protein product [Leptosia nina]|uniref:Uncharacterized protein n=1 Tax=Leptosia nina TaxID=320188 RepID=A0AAV1J1J0_9NEOP
MRLAPAQFLVAAVSDILFGRLGESEKRACDVTPTAAAIILTAVYLCVAVHIVQSSEENANTTTLYPINKTIDYKDSEEVTNITNAPITNDKSTEINSVKNAITDIEKPSNKSEGSKVNSKSETATWKVDAVLSPPTQGSNKVWTSFKEKPDASKEFKPSQQLGHFYDEDAFIASTVSSRDSFVPIKTTSSFIGSNEFVKLQYKTTKDFSKAQPYKFENSFSKAKAPPEGYDSKPTVEVPVKIPAGSLYKYQDPFKEKPGDGGDDFGLDFSGDKDKEVKKRKNPWHGLLNLVTALIPIGILVSALTPSIVTLQTTE